MPPHFLRIILASTLFMVFEPAVDAQQPAKDLTPLQKEERDRYSKESTALELKDPRQSIAAAEKMLAIERAALGDVHKDVVGSLIRLARMRERLWEYEPALKERQEILTLQSKLHGASSYQAIAARVYLNDLELRMRLDANGRQALREADDLRKMAPSNPAFKGQADLAESALAIYVRVLGKDCLATAYAAEIACAKWL